MNPVKRLRLEKGLTQREMAERLGVDIRTYQRWEAKMSVSKKVLVSVMAVVATLAGCGGESSSKKDEFQGAAAPAPVVAQEETKPTSYLVETEAELPKCETKSKGWLVYVNESSVFKACSGTEWKVVDLKGKDGAAGKDGVAGTNGTDGVQGAQGVAGAKGDKGDAGDSGKVVKKVSCTGSKTISPDVFYFTTQIVFFSNGDRFVNCGFESGEVGTPDNNSSTSYHAADTNGASRAVCYVGAHIGSTISGYDYFEFEGDANGYYAKAKAANGSLIDSTTLSCTETTY